MNDKRLSYPTGALRRSWQSIVCRAVLFCLVCLMPGALWAATYYVDASNASVGDGSIDDPWRDISSITGIGTDDTILFKRGKIWHEPLVIPADGVTIGAYDDPADPTAPLPVFDGTTTVSWASQGGDIYTAPWASGDPGMVIYKGVPKPSIATLTFSSDVSGVKANDVLIQSGGTAGYCSFWVTSVSAPQVYGITFFRKSKHWNTSQNVQWRRLVNGKEVNSDLSLRSPGLSMVEQSLENDGEWYWNGVDTLYLRSSTNPNSIVQISNLLVGIDANNKNKLTIEDITVQGFQDMGIRLHGTSGSTVQRMEVKNIGAIEEDISAGIKGYKTGIMIDYASNNFIKDNQVDGVLRVGIGLFAGYTADLTQGNTVSGNTIKNSGSSGVSLNTDDLSMASTVVNNKITGNTILYSNRLAYDSAGVYAIFVGTENSITNNTILYGGSKYLRSAGVMIDQGVVPPVSITGNRIENNSLGGIVVTGTGHTITGNRLAYNGLASWNSAQIMFFPVAENVSGTIVRNNVVEAETGKYLFMRTIDPSLPEQSNNDIDYNTYRSRAAATLCWSDDWSCGSWVNFSTWKSTTGHDTNSSFSFITDPPPPDTKSISSTYLLLLK